MIKYDKEAQQMIPTSEILVLGLGGAGANMIDCVIIEGLKGPEILAINADLRTLQSSSAKKKIQLGPHVTRGLGCGGDPEIGQKAAMESEADIRAAIRGRKIIFLCVGLGGGTGSGASPLITRIAREEGAFTVVFATMPFAFEGTRRRVQAETALNELAAIANALVTFDNGRMAELVLANQGIHDAFSAANSLISESIHAISRIALYPGIVHIGLDDLVTTLSSNRSRCLFGAGRASKEDRVLKALEKALNSPLIDKGKLLKTVDAVLVHICGGPSLTIFESELMMSELTKKINPSAQIFFGVSVDDSLEDEFSVTIISSLPEEQVTIDPIEDINLETAPTAISSPTIPPTIPLPLEQAIVEPTPVRTEAQEQEPVPPSRVEPTPEIRQTASAPLHDTIAVEQQPPPQPAAQPLGNVSASNPNALAPTENNLKKTEKTISKTPEISELEQPVTSSPVEEFEDAELSPEVGGNTRRRFAHLFKKQEEFEEEQLPSEIPVKQEDPRLKADLPPKTRKWLDLVDESHSTEVPELNEIPEHSAAPVTEELDSPSLLPNELPDLPSQVPFQTPSSTQKKPIYDEEEPTLATVKKKKTKKKQLKPVENIPTTEELLAPRAGMNTQSLAAKVESEEDLFSNAFAQGELELDGKPKGRFEGESPNVYEGEDLDIPTFLRDMD